MPPWGILPPRYFVTFLFTPPLVKRRARRNNKAVFDRRKSFSKRLHKEIEAWAST